MFTSCLRKQQDGRGLNPGVRGVNRSATHATTEEHQANFNYKGESNKAKGNQSVLKLLLLAFSWLDGIYQDCSFLLLLSYYFVIIIIVIINSSLEKIEELLVYLNVFKTYVHEICVK